MKNYKFGLSALVSGKWFHKLKNMNNPRKKSPPPPPCSLNTTKKKNSSSESKSLTRSSRSYSSNNRLHTSSDSKTLQVSPRNPPHMMQSKRKSAYKPSQPSAGLHKNKIKFPRNQDSFSATCNLKLTSSAHHIVLDTKRRDFKMKMFRETKVLDSAEKACPATKQTKGTLKTHNLSVKVNNKKKEEDACRIQTKHQKPFVSSGRRSSANSPGIRLRVTSPRVQVSPRGSRSRLQSKQALDSFAVIKSSLDPKKDFRESMVEMIKENNIRASKDLEDLLACYLSLNHKEYHDLIIKVFIQVWLEVIKST